jgi:hypothetical protein
MKLPELALPDERLVCPLSNGWIRNKYEGDDGNNKERERNGKDKEEIRGNGFIFGEGISINGVNSGA